MKKGKLLFASCIFILFVLIFLNNVESAIPSQAANDSNNVYRCGDINSSGSYILNQSFSPSESCLNISANNVILDFAGFNISCFATSVLNDANNCGSAVILSGNGTIIKNGKIIFENRGTGGISATSTSNNTIENMTIQTRLGQGILLTNSKNGTIRNNTLKLNGVGIQLFEDSDNNLFMITLFIPPHILDSFLPQQGVRQVIIPYIITP
jgi:parallel beta-helix repeat protein